MITRSNLLEHWLEALIDGVRGTLDPLGTSPIIAFDLIEPPAGRAYPDDSCRERGRADGASRASSGSPSSAPDDPRRLVGIVVDRRPAQGPPADRRGGSEARTILRPRPDPPQTASGLRGVRV